MRQYMVNTIKMRLSRSLKSILNVSTVLLYHNCILLLMYKCFVILLLFANTQKAYLTLVQFLYFIPSMSVNTLFLLWRLKYLIYTQKWARMRMMKWCYYITKENMIQGAQFSFFSFNLFDTFCCGDGVYK